MGKKKEMFSEHGKKPPYQIKDCLAIGPQSAYGGPKLSDLKKLGFKHIIDLNADTNEEHEARRVGLEYHSMGISDESSKRVWLSKLSSAVETIRGASDRGEPVYLHCTHGVGRSPTFAIAYLMSKGHSIEEA